jgi:hypothetical protein
MTTRLYHHILTAACVRYRIANVLLPIARRNTASS